MFLRRALPPLPGPHFVCSPIPIQAFPNIIAPSTFSRMFANSEINKKHRRSFSTNIDEMTSWSCRDEACLSPSEIHYQEDCTHPIESSILETGHSASAASKSSLSREVDTSRSQTSRRKSWPLPEEYRRKFLTSLGLKLGVKESDFSGWYKVTKSELRRVGGTTALAFYENSLPALLKAIFPEFAWDEAKFRVSKTKSQKSFVNHRKRVLEIGSKLGIPPTEFSKWYQVSYTDFRKKGGSSILPYYNSSLSTVLTSLFPEHDWDLTKFDRKPNNYWESVENQRAFMLALGKELGIKEGDYLSWASVTKQTVVRYGGSRLLNLHRSSMRELLSFVFPDHKWKADLEDLNRS